MWGRITGNTGESKVGASNSTSEAKTIDKIKPGAFANTECKKGCKGIGHGHSTISSAKDAKK